MGYICVLHVDHILCIPDISFDSARPHQLELEGVLTMAMNGMTNGGAISGTPPMTGLGTITVGGELSGGHRLRRTRVPLIMSFGVLRKPIPLLYHILNSSFQIQILNTRRICKRM